MLRVKPKLTYSGLTIVLSNPSRFDLSNNSLLTATGGYCLNNHCLRPDLNVMQCDVRLADDTGPWLDGTKCILLLGEYAMHKLVPDSQKNSLNELRGSPLKVGDINAIASFFPQDASDPSAHEQHLNTESKEYVGDEEHSGSGDEDKDEGDVKGAGNTARSNYAFWLRRDVWKCKQILKHGGSLPPRAYPSPIYHIYPPCDEVVNILTKTKRQWMDFDIETDYEEQNLLCFAFTFDGINIYSVPVLNQNYQWAYSGLHCILRALAIAFHNNTVVAHNGATFDALVMAMKYHIPIVKMWDTMMAQHRIFPDVEKSLAHCTSYWLWERFHKDMDPASYFTQDDMMNKLRYCAKDVYTMSCFRKAQQAYATTIPGLVDSISCAMASIRPYLTCTLTGIPYSESLRQAKVKENDCLMMQYLRIINLLIGETGMKDAQSSIKSKKPGAFPSSNPQCCRYFHDMLGYPVVAKGKPSKVDGYRKPSLAKKAMFKFRLKHENPVIDFCIAYRQVKLETSTPLSFKPFKDDEGNILKRSADQQQIQLPLPGSTGSVIAG